MKMRTSRKVHYDSGPNMTPLVDIVMVILIFLMLTGTFAVGEHFLQSNIPVAKKGVGGSSSSNVPQDEPLEIRVDSYTRPGQEGGAQDTWAAQAGGFLLNSRPQLTAQLQRMRETMSKNGIDPDNIQVVINPGRATKYKHLIEVYEAALNAKFSKVAFSTAH